jgi:hypothetical protein
MSCCTPTGYRTIFGAKTVERDARRYRRKGLTGSAGWLVHKLTRNGLDDAAVLEVGGGIGCLQIELLEAGASYATNVEMVDSYEEAARELIAERRLEGRIDRRVADYVQEAEHTPAADIVVMHRVICCYPDAGKLTSAACGRARDRVAITIPRDVWWVRLGFAGMNAWLRLRRIGFRGYVHPRSEILDAAAAHGFRVTHQGRDLLWESVILQHTLSAAAGGAAR